MTTTTANILIVNISDRAVTESCLNKIESLARGTIRSWSDDGCGRMTLRVQPRVRPTKADRKAILSAVQTLAPKSHWV